ncbi:hypothetical protein QFC22_002969 [Naganishia vaughanmartiniae]|uniref:Uncharacterized protein n=1 Tax=Naganishia vaughanmartiniae TaxID=1424756 RepID=A0ACC2XAH6_9TREE|nr:hypothetical protein QFC22_002969 [Naganishia vaughanmartiniae]
MTPFDPTQTQWAMPHSSYANYYASVEDPMCQRTGTSGSGSDGMQDIIPGGEFDEPDLQHHSSLKKSSTSSKGFVRPNDIMTLPQTPHHRSYSNNQGASESMENNVYRNVSYSSPSHYSGGSDSAMDCIGDRTKRMNMLSTPIPYLSSSSPTSMSTMPPSAFRLTGVPMTPDPSSAFGKNKFGNEEAQSQSFQFSPSQPQVMQFVPGPPPHTHVEHPGSTFPFINSFNGQSDGSFIPQSFRGPLVPSMALPLSTSVRSDLTTATSGSPSTPTDPCTIGRHDSNSFVFQVKTEPGEETTAVDNERFQQQQGSNDPQRHLPSSPGASYSFDNRQYYHPYRLTQTEPINRVATVPVASNYSPATPSLFAFSHPLPTLGNANSSPTSIQSSSAVGGTANHSSTNIRHQHSGSLQFPMTWSTTGINGSGAAARLSYLQSMSLLNRGMKRHPVSPGGESLRSEGDSELDDELSESRQPQSPRGMLEYGSPRRGLSNGPRLAKNHIWYVTGAGICVGQKLTVKLVTPAIYAGKLSIVRHL